MPNISDNPLFQTGVTYTAADMRTLNRDDFQFPGVVRGQLNALAVAPTTPASTMAVFVASGAAVLQDTRATGDSDFWRVTSRADPVTVTISNGDATHSRYDLIVIRVRNTEMGDGTTSATIEAVEGTPAASPSVPATPDGSVALAEVLVTAGNATGITAGNITDLRTYAVRAPTATTNVDSNVDPGWTAGTIVVDENDGKARVKVNGALSIIGGGGGLPTTTEFYAHPLPLSSATLTSSTNTVTTASVHGLVVGDVVMFDGIHSAVGSTSSVLPYTPYFVKTVPTSATLTLSTSSGGSTLSFGCDGSSAAVRKVPLAGGGGATMASNVFTTPGAHGLAIGDVLVFGTMTTTNLTPAKSFYVLTVPTSTTFTVSATNSLLPTSPTTQSLTDGSTAAVVKIGGWVTWTCPTDVRTAFGQVVSGGGGGGAGGGGNASTNASKDGGGAGSAGSGAASGGCFDFGPIPVTPGTTYSFYLGHGGLGGKGGAGGLTSGGAGSTGSSSFEGGMSQVFGFTLGGGGQGIAGFNGTGQSGVQGGSTVGTGTLDYSPGGGSGGGANGAAVSTSGGDTTSGSNQSQAGPANGGNGGYLVTLAAADGSTGTAAGGTKGTALTVRLFASVYKPSGGAGGQAGQGGFGGTSGAVSSVYYSGQGGSGGIGGKHNANQPGASQGGGTGTNSTLPTNSTGATNASNASSAANLNGGAGGHGQPGQPSALPGEGGNGGGGGAGGGGGRNTSTFARGGDGGAGAWGGPGYLALSYVVPS